MSVRGLCAVLALGLGLAGPALAGPDSGGPVFHPRGDDRPFSESVQAGPVLYLSGMIGEAADGPGVVPGGLEPETHRIMERMGQTLKARGLGFDDVFKCTVMLADMREWQRFNAIYAAYFKPGRLPARSAMGVSGLALGARVELECMAWAGGRAKRGRR